MKYLILIAVLGVIGCNGDDYDDCEAQGGQAQWYEIYDLQTGETAVINQCNTPQEICQPLRCKLGGECPKLECQ